MARPNGKAAEFPEVATDHRPDDAAFRCTSSKMMLGGRLLLSRTPPVILPVKVYLITQGTWDVSFNKLNASGVTAWRLKSGKVGFANTLTSKNC